MKEQEILEGSKLIAEFMGYHLCHLDAEKTIPYWNHGDKYFKPKAVIRIDKGESFEYHTSWDWLMPVVEKIAEYRLAYPAEANEVCDSKIVIGKEYLWRKCVAFIKWYNTQSLPIPQ